MSQLPPALAGVPDSVHDARVASRRVREVLGLVAAEPDVRPGKAVRRLRRLRRGLGRVREFDAGRSLLDEIAEAHPELSGEVQTAKGWLGEVRLSRAEALEALGDSVVRKLEKQLVRLFEPTGDGSAAVPAPPVIAAHIARRRRRLLRAMDRAQGARAGRLHSVRIALKRLRYSAELVAQLTRSRADRPVASLKRMQALLGRMHDLQVLAGHLRRFDRPRFAATLAIVEVETRALHEDYLRRRTDLRRAAADLQRLCSLRAVGGRP